MTYSYFSGGGHLIISSILHGTLERWVPALFTFTYNQNADVYAFHFEVLMNGVLSILDPVPLLPLMEAQILDFCESISKSLFRIT